MNVLYWYEVIATQGEKNKLMVTNLVLVLKEMAIYFNNYATRIHNFGVKLYVLKDCNYWKYL